MSDDQDKQQGDSSRVSVRFLVDNQPYNAGESAVFNEHVAAKLAQLNIVKLNTHPVKNDSNLLALINGDNNDSPKKAGGMDEKQIADLIDKKLDEKLKPLLDELKKSDTGPKSPLAPAIKK